jgi:hypothetical protein
MFGWLYDVLVTFVQFVLSFFGIQWGAAKQVRFEDGSAPSHDQGQEGGSSVVESVEQAVDNDPAGDDVI